MAADSVAVTFWGSGGRRLGSLEDRPKDGEIAWFDIDIVNGDEESVWQALRPLCPGLDQDMVDDLFIADVFPGVKFVGEKRNIRAVSITEVTEARPDEAEPDVAALSEPESDVEALPELEFNLVELLTGDGWLISAWHEGQVYVGSSPKRGKRPPPKRAFSFQDEIAEEWRGGKLRVGRRARHDGTSSGRRQLCEGVPRSLQLA